MPARTLPPITTPEHHPLATVRIVLVRARGAANVGAAARAMKNLGAVDLVLVCPRFPRLAAAERMAVHARDVVRGARIVADLGAAVADCRLVVGTTCRGGGYRTAAAEPMEVLAPLLLGAAARGPVAIVFGPEDRGLTNDDLRHCQRLCTLDTDAEYPSLNLAQAVLLVCWELRRAAGDGVRPAPGATAAPAAMVQQLYIHLHAALGAIGFLNPQNPEHIMFPLRRLLGRAAVTEHEVRILRGMARQRTWAAERGVTDDRLPVTSNARAAPHRSPVTGQRSRR